MYVIAKLLLFCYYVIAMLFFFPHHDLWLVTYIFYYVDHANDQDKQNITAITYIFYISYYYVVTMLLLSFFIRIVIFCSSWSVKQLHPKIIFFPFFPFTVTVFLESLALVSNLQKKPNRSKTI